MSKQSKYHLGYNAKELRSSPYARWYNPEIAPLAPHVQQALLVGPVSSGLMPPVSDACLLLEQADQLIETGYTHAKGGEVRLAIKTEMPGVTPAMWDWWFGWHGSDGQRYKLWHPQAHLNVAWLDGEGFTGGYVGRTSHVHEYVGASVSELYIQFIPPSQIGLDEARLQSQGEVAICARIGLGNAPIDFGWLIHQLRPVEGGCEMRSRFWLGGSHLALRFSNPIASVVSKLLPLARPLPKNIGADLLVHCAQEMGHLAQFLPALYAELSA